MSSGIVDEAVEAAAPAALTSEQIAYAKAVIAGRITPAPLECPAVVEDMRVRFKDMVPQPTAEAVRYQVDHAAIHKLGAGELVAYTELPDGYAAVLVVGTDAAMGLARTLTPEERSKTVITDTLDMW